MFVRYTEKMLYAILYASIYCPLTHITICTGFEPTSVGTAISSKFEQPNGKAYTLVLKCLKTLHFKVTLILDLKCRIINIDRMWVKHQINVSRLRPKFVSRSVRSY